MLGKLQAAQREHEARGLTLQSCREALQAAEQRASLLSGTITELEENVVVLRKQLLETDRRGASRESQLSERTKLAEKQLTYRLSELQEVSRKKEVLSDKLRAEKAAGVAARQEAGRVGKQAENAALALQRLKVAHAAAGERLTQANMYVLAVWRNWHLLSGNKRKMKNPSLTSTCTN